VCDNAIPSIELPQPIPVYNVDGTENQASAITYVVDASLFLQNRFERTLFAVTNLGDQQMLLSHDLLVNHNPEIDWAKGEVKFTRCHSHCSECLKQHLAERSALCVQQQESANLEHVRRIFFPSLNHHIQDITDEDEDKDDSDPHKDDSACKDGLKDGDRLFITSYREELPQTSETICATSTVSQQIAEGMAKNAPHNEIPALDLVPSQYHNFDEVFSKESFDSLLEHRLWDHAIEIIPDAKIPNWKLYPLSIEEQAQLDAFLEENLSSGCIRPSKSPIVAPFFFIKKKDGSLQLVQDYRALNAVTVKNQYPLPLIDDLVNKIQGAWYFMKLDVRWGYNNVRIKEGDEWKAAFRTNWGMFTPLVMFFGLTNLPVTFQTMMNDIFADLIAEGHVIIDLNNILIFTRTLEEHRQIVCRVLEKLCSHKLYLKPKKCEFEKESIEYFGLIISHNHVVMDPAKVAGVLEWPVPVNLKEVQSFVGFLNFYCHFIKGFAKVARPLHNLTKKGTPFKFGTEELAAFAKLKELITSAPILMLPNLTQPSRVEADSSDFATGGVLSQLCSDDGKWHPVAFLSKSLSAVEQNYKTHDKEMLTIIRALKEWRHFLEGAQHTVEIWRKTLAGHFKVECFN
jgi:hypothetical protein